MTETIKLGDRVQAVDELGRWTAGKVSNISDSGVGVKFIGWGEEFGKEVTWEEVRLPLPPLEEQVRRSCVLEQKRCRGKRSNNSTNTSTLCRGETIYVDGIQETVETVDPFSCAVVLQDGRTVSFRDLCETPTCYTSPQKRRRTKSSLGKHLPCTENHCQSVAEKNNDCTHIEEVVLDVSLPKDDAGVYTTHDVTCGTIYKVVDSGLLIAVAFIDIFLKIITGWLVNDEGVDRSCVLQLPVHKLTECAQPKLGAKDRKALVNCRDVRFTQTMENMEQNSYRKEMRKEQLITILRRETALALSRRHKCHSFSLGLYVPDVDSELLNIIPRCRVMRHSYALRNLQELDEMLGPRWDVQFIDNRTPFITSVSIKLTKDYSVSVVVRSGLFLGHIVPNTYRNTLAAHIEDLSRLQTPPDTTAEGDVYEGSL